MRLTTLAVTVCVCAGVFGNLATAQSQTGPSCPYLQGVPIAACTGNPNTDHIPSNMGGSPISTAGCSSALIEAMASLYSYDDPTCHSNSIALSSGLKFVADATDYLLLPGYKELAQEYNLQVTLYCETEHNLLIAAYRGSEGLTPLTVTPFASVAEFDDWVDTNLLQHLGTVPLQYNAAWDIAFELKKELAEGNFDKICGDGRPKLILTGHSKGGGEAQYAALKKSLDAIVFNSDPLNPVIFTGWFSTKDTPLILHWLERAGRSLKSIMRCFPNQPGVDPDVDYRNGNIRDIRMVNDFIVRDVLPICNFPHAPIEWVADTLNCSAANGHAIATVVRELRACRTAQ